ncbi:hypothetical protein D3C87_628380 [compost metagenome]
MSQLEIRFVNKYESVWNPKTMFSGFKVRAVLIKSNDVITNITEMHQLRRRLQRELGTEDEDWILEENPNTLENELYLQNSGKLVMWKLQDNDKFISLFAFVEQHTDDAEKLEAQRVKDFEDELKAREEARLQRFAGSDPKRSADF